MGKKGAAEVSENKVHHDARFDTSNISHNFGISFEIANEMMKKLMDAFDFEVAMRGIVE